MIMVTNTRITVFTRRFTHNEESLKNFRSIDTRKKPMIRLRIKTFTSRSMIASIVLVSGSEYFTGKTFDAALRKNRKRSTSVHEMAMINITLTSYFFTTDPRGNMSLEVRFIILIYDGYAVLRC